ncbi:MAG: nucleoside hydrolase [Candidatus Woesearchaeota archaeon]|nr:nucleoside hydrolase [Candidatus Woesearchaeota archaeon]
MKKIIIDTDPGVDDALAILYAAQLGTVDIRALTTVFGNLSLEQTTRNARILSDMLGGTVPVYQGAEKQLCGELCPLVAQSQVGGFDFFQGEPTARIQGDALDALISIIQKNPYEITLVAIGPLTNVANLASESPSAFAQLKDLVIMGGAINTYGNTTAVGEFNFCCDPEAADYVMSADGPPKTLVPVNVCRQAVMTPTEVASFPATDEGNCLRQLVADYVRYYLANEGLGGGVLYDPVAVGIGIDPTYITNQQSAYVRVETRGEFTKGMSIADLRQRPTKEPNCNLVLSIDAERFKRDFYRVLLNPSQTI